MNTQLVFNRNTLHIVVPTKRSIVVQQIFRNDETRNSLCSWRSIRSTRQHQVNDVFGHVVFAKRNVNLGSGDVVGAVGILDCLGANRTDIATRIGFGEIHCARPFASNHLGQIGHALIFTAVIHQRVNRSLSQQRAHRKCHVGRSHHFLNGNANHPRESTAAVTTFEWHCSPTCIDIGLICSRETRCSCDCRVGIEFDTEVVAHFVERRNFVFHEAPCFFKKVTHH